MLVESRKLFEIQSYMVTNELNGPSIKSILREDILLDLECSLPERARPFLNYMRCLRHLHKVRTDYRIVLEDFSVNFNYLFDHFKMNMSLKVHIILHHCSDNFDWTGKTF